MKPSVASYGGGVNSTAMLIGLVERGERPDLILFSDTGGEKPETYAYRNTFNGWLVGHGFPEITTVSDGRRTLEAECLESHTLPSIVVGLRSCSDKYKIRPQNRFVSSWQPAIDAWASGEVVTKLIGFDAGEPWRVKDYSSPRYGLRYPLIEWGWGREECIAAIRETTLLVPPKSSCFYCPEMREAEIISLRDGNPELFERALQMERGNTHLYGVAGLARKYSWQQIADYHDRQQSLPMLPERLPCVCFDGEA